MLDKLDVTKLVLGQLQTNCYIVRDLISHEAIIIDPADDADYISQILQKLVLKPILIMATHGHFDHILVAGELQQIYKIPFLVHQKDQFLVGRMPETAQHFLGYKVECLPPQTTDYLRLGKQAIKAIETPGHTPGSVSFYIREQPALFTGDTIFAGGGQGRTDFTYSSRLDLQKSIKKILGCPNQTVLYPGHGSDATVSKEKRWH